MFESKQRSYGDLIEGILIGGSLAALTTFMLGTAKGKKLKKELMQKASEMRANIEKATRSPAARKVKRAVKKAAKSATARKVKRAVKAKIAKKTARRTTHMKRARV